MIHNERLIVVLDKQHAIKSATVYPIEWVSDSKAYQLDPRDLAPGELPELAALISVATIAERDRLAGDLSKATTDRDQLTAECDSLTSQLQSTADELNEAQTSLVTSANEVTTLRSQLDDALTQITGWQSVVDARDATIAQRDAIILSLQAEIDVLRNPPLNPRHVAPYVFLSLLLPQEIYALQTSADAVIVVARAKLQTIITYIDLDLPETVQLVHYLETIGLTAPGRAEKILAGESPT